LETIKTIKGVEDEDGDYNLLDAFHCIDKGQDNLSWMVGALLPGRRTAH